LTASQSATAVVEIAALAKRAEPLVKKITADSVDQSALPEASPAKLPASTSKIALKSI
jgi:hypothetical protein